MGAIKNSCNSYFYQWGRDAKLSNLERVGDALGLGMKSGLPLSGESGGNLPGARWLAAHGQSILEKSWGHIANSSIGQGSVLASPLQMAMVCATLANGGTSYFPRLVHRVVDGSGGDVRDEQGNLVVPVEPKVRADLHQMGLSAAEVEVVRQGMWKVVNEAGGTGKNARIKGVEVAGKTGTAQFWRQEGKERVKDNHVWFICFAPYKEPRFAICVMIQGAKSGGGVAAPVAQKILSESLALDAGYEPAITWMNPVEGSLAQIVEITLKDEGGIGTLVASTFQGTDTKPGARGSVVDEETADHTDEPDRAGTASRDSARPDVRKSADDRGRVGSGDGKPNLWQRLFGPGKSRPPASGPGSTSSPRR
jgi:penicillin-binding protein 2